MNAHGLRASSRRASLIAVSLLLPLAVGTAGAHAACNDPELQISKETAKAGEKVAYSINDTTPGTEYLLKVAESELNAGTATADSVAGAFKMPDLGANGRGANVVAILDNEQCENGPWKLVQAMTYAAPAGSKPAQEKNAGTAPGANKQLANFKAQRAKERQAALKREKALRKELKKRQAAAKRRAQLQKKKAKENQRKQRLTRAKRKKAFEKALLARQKAQKEKAKQAQAQQQKNASGNKTTQDRPRGDGDSSKAFVALGLLYTLIGGLGGGGFLLYRRSGRGVPMSKREADAAAALPPVPEFGETTGVPAVRPGGLPASPPEELDAAPEELDAEPKTPQADDFDSLALGSERRNGPSGASEKSASADGAAETLSGQQTDGASDQADGASDKEKLETELRRLLTDAGIDAELDGIIADAQAEAERRGVPMDSNLMMQLLTGGGDSSASELKAKLQEIVAEEKERVALRNHEG